MMANLDRSVTDAKTMTHYIWNSYISWGLNHTCGLDACGARACKPGPVAIVRRLRVGIKQIGGMAAGIQGNQSTILPYQRFPWQYGSAIPVRHDIADGLPIKIYFRHDSTPVAK
jgi:hypothetical protein